MTTHPGVQLLEQRPPLHRFGEELFDHRGAKTALRNEYAKPGPESVRDLLKRPHLFVELLYRRLETLDLRSPHGKKNLVVPFCVGKSALSPSPGLKDVASAFSGVEVVQGNGTVPL